jgi:hypothetical protein
MTRSESQFRIWYKKTHPTGYIHKIPDFKATGSSGGAGLPDYLTIDNATVAFYEVKTHKSKTFTEAQQRIFPKMCASGAVIYIWVKLKRGYSCYLYK